jgi:hypothetical protein
MKARLSLLHKTEANWNKLPDFVPYSGEVIIFDPDSQYNYARLKIGDGNTKLQELPFIMTSAISEYNQAHNLVDIIDCGRITAYTNK